MTDPLGDPVRYEYYSLAQKYAWAQGGMGPAATEPAAAALHTLSSTFDESANNVRKALGSIGVNWRGQAANATSDALRRAAQATSATGESSRSGSNQIEAVGQSWANTKARIPPPIEVGSRNFKDWATDAFDAAFGGVFDIQSDYRKRLHAYQNADATANDALREHEQNVRAANAAFPDFATRPLPAPAPPGPAPAMPQPPTSGGPGAPGPVPPGGPAPNGSPVTPTQPQHNAPAPRAPNPSPAPAPTSPPSSPAPNGGGLLRPDPGGGWIPLVPGTPTPGRRPFPPRRPGPLGPRGDPTGMPGQPNPPQPTPTAPSPGTRPPGPPGTGVPGPSTPRPGGPTPGMLGGSGSGGSGPDGLGPDASGGGQPQPPGGSGPGGVAPLPPSATPGGAAGVRPRGSGARPGRSEGGGWDWGDIGIAVGGPVVGALAAGGAYATVAHYRRHGVGKTLRRSPFQVRVNRAGRHAREAAEEQGEGGLDRPGLAYDWAQDVLARDENGQQIHGRCAFNVGGKGEIPQWLNPCSAPGIGFAGPGAHDTLRCCVLTILLRTGRRPAGRIIIPTSDATILLGGAQPDVVPEGLRIVEDYDHALAALDAEITQRRTATREQLEHMPLVVLVLAEPPPTPEQVDDLTELLRAARRLGVSAVIGDRWAGGATLEIDENFVVTATTDHAVHHLRNAYLFHLPAGQLAGAYQDIDNANAAAVYRYGPPPGAHADTPATEPTAAETTGTRASTTEAGAEGDSCTASEPATAHPGGLDPDHPNGGPLAGQDQHSEAPTAGAVAHIAPPAPETGPAAQTGTASTEALPDGPASGMERILNPPETIKLGVAEEEQTRARTPAGTHADTAAGETTTAGRDNAREAVSTAVASSMVVRLEILNTPRMLVIPAGTPEDPDPQPSNITPGARSRTQTQVWIYMALNRDGRRRAVIAADLFPETHPDRPATNTLNTNMTRLRQFIQDKTSGAVTDLVHVTEEGLCRLDPDVVEVDYWEFLDATSPDNAMSTPERARAFQAALKGYRGELAENVDADWITSYRDDTQTAVLKAAVDLAYDLSDNHGDHDTAIAILDQAIGWDPLAESLYQHVIGLLMNLGRRDAAIQRYEALKTVLDRELDGMTPQPETTRLIWP